MDIRWPDRGTVLVDIDGRTLRVVGEALLERRPDFLIFPEHITHWEDGAPLEDAEKSDVLSQVIEAAAARGWIFAILRRDE
ncbi:Imm74 family immunity protein [Spirillospora sp. NPDC047418]|jgi:hypothetical protein